MSFQWFKRFQSMRCADPISQQSYTKLQRPRDELTEASRTFYSPFWTRTLVLCLFLASFIILLTALEIIKRVSDSDHALAQINDQQYWYYTWTYGPTAILTILLALWNRVDFRIRQMTPWKNLNPAQLSAQDDSLFIDYVSSTLPEILCISARKRHFLVLASSLNSIIMTLLVVISTALLIPAERSTRLPGMPYRIDSDFRHDYTGFIVPESSLPLDIVDAIDLAGLAYPPGTTSDLNYQRFTKLSTGVDGIWDLELNVTAIDVSCEPAKIIGYEWTNRWECPLYLYSDGGSSLSEIHVQAGNCSTSIDINTNSFTGGDGNAGNFAFFKTAYCDTGIPYRSDYNNLLLVFGLGHALQHGSMGSKPTITDIEDISDCEESYPVVKIEILKSSQWICKTQIAVTAAEVHANATELEFGIPPTVSVLFNATKHVIDSGWLTTLFDQLFDVLAHQTFNDDRTSDLFSSLNLTLGRHDESIGGQIFDSQYATFVRLFRHIPANTTFDDLMDTTLLVHMTQTWFKRMYVQLIDSILTVPLNDTVIEGSIWVSRNVLTVRNIPARLMQTLLGLNIILTGCILTRAFGGTEYDPARLVGLTLLLRFQSKFRKAFSGSGGLSFSGLRCRIDSKRKGVARKPLAAEVKEWELAQRWWQPFPLKISIRLLITALVLIIVVVLQVLLVLSKKNQGLANVSVTGDVHLAWSIVPALTMVGIAIYVRSFGSCYKAFSPYYRLRQKTSVQALFCNYLTMTEPEVIGAAFKRHDWAIICVALAIILTATLTVVVSGVWTAAPVMAVYEQDMTPQSFFSGNYSGVAAGNTDGNAFVSGLIVALNLSYPKWTYKDLAIASYSLPEDISDGQSTVTVELPAIRTALNCTFYAQDEIPDLRWDTDLRQYYPNATPATAVFKMPGPAHCRGDKPVFQMTGGVSRDMDKKAPKGGVFLENQLPNCPRLNYFWGGLETYNKDISDLENTTYIQGLSCYETIEQLRVETTLTADLNITTYPPPRVIEESVSSFSNTSVDIPYGRLPVLKTNGTSDVFFWALIHYRYGSDFISNFESEEQRNKIIDAIKTTHCIIRAQQFHSEMRSTDAVALKRMPATLTATVRNPQRHRLLQNTVSTHILCGLLAAILILMSITSWLMSTKNVLPKNPSSIAAQISLLADSNIFNNPDLLDILEDMSKSRTPENKILADTKFGMGWFTNKSDGPRLFSIHVVETVPASEVDEGTELVNLSPTTQLGQDSSEVKSLTREGQGW